MFRDIKFAVQLVNLLKLSSNNLHETFFLRDNKIFKYVNSLKYI